MWYLSYILWNIIYSKESKVPHFPILGKTSQNKENERQLIKLTFFLYIEKDKIFLLKLQCYVIYISLKGIVHELKKILSLKIPYDKCNLL